MLRTMSWLFGIVAAVGLVRVKCTHCGHQQIRGRADRDAAYVCRKCHKTFSREMGERAFRRPPDGESPR